MRGARVLVVEDEPLIAMMLEDMLVDLGCVVLDTAASLEIALRMAATLDFDFCLLDMSLSGKASAPVLEILRSRKLPVIVSTGLTPDRMADLGAEIILSKPFSLVSLTAAVTRLKLAPR